MLKKSRVGNVWGSAKRNFEVLKDRIDNMKVMIEIHRISMNLKGSSKFASRKIYEWSEKSLVEKCPV